MNKFPEYIMHKLRQREGLEYNDPSKDAVLNNYSSKDAFSEVLAWEGFIGNWSDQIIGWLRDCGFTVE